MSRPNGVANERFDEAGFEVPFAASFEGEALSGSEATFGTESESPFSESTFGAEAESAYEDEAESYDESEWEGEAEAALSENEWGEAEDETEAEAAEREAQEAEVLLGRFYAFGDERDAEWELDEDEVSFEGQGPLAGSGLSTADVPLGTLRHTSKNGKTFTYKFTEDDLVWTARYL